MSEISISKLQKYIKEQDFIPDIEQGYFLKLVEEVGELSRAIHKKNTPASENALKGTIEEEICDVIYYAIAIANQYNIDIEKWFVLKEKLNDIKYNRNHANFLVCL